jgi:hypothetical protein
MAPSVSTGKKVDTTITTLLNVRRGADAVDFHTRAFGTTGRSAKSWRRPDSGSPIGVQRNDAPKWLSLTVSPATGGNPLGGRWGGSKSDLVPNR